METNYKKTIYKETTENEVDYKKITYKLEGLNNLPEEPGIYFMKDKEDRLLYVGKSKCLKKRVKSHFLNSTNRSRKNREDDKKYISYRYYKNRYRI